MSIQAFIQYEILLPRLKQNGVLVVYDPAQRYRELCRDLASDSRKVIDATESSIESRETAIRILGKLSQPNASLQELLVYVPAQAPLTDVPQ